MMSSTPNSNIMIQYAQTPNRTKRRMTSFLTARTADRLLKPKKTVSALPTLKSFL